MMRLKHFILLISMILTTACGFKINNLQKKFTISEINTSGEKKINFRIKNKVLANNDANSDNLIKLDITTKKVKSIKEKNISNEIEKYQISIVTNVSYMIIKNKNSGDFNISKSGDYNVSSKYSDTINSEKRLINNLTQEIIQEIIDNLASKFNDL